jgi:FkbM family methyltransferase
LLSNTYGFYRRGWQGLNVDARPGSMRRFRLLRRRDINVEAAIGKSPGTATFFLSDVDRHANSLTAAEHHDQSMTVEVTTLAELLTGNLAPGQPIDFMSVDVEGHDLEVLLGNDWTLWRPEFVLVEQLLAHSLEETLSDPTTGFMTTVGYTPIATNSLTCVFRRNEAIG